MNIMPTSNIHTLFKVTAIIAFALLTAGLFSAWLTPCTGWEANIYTETPLIFWIGVFAAYIIGIAITLYSQFYKPLPKYLRFLGWSLIAFAAVSLIFLAIIRGYKIMNLSGDTGSHVGILSLLLKEGQITGTYYPGIYWEPAALCLLSGIEPIVVLKVFPALLGCLSILGIILLARRIFPNDGEICLASIIAFLLPSGSAPLFFSGSGASYYVGMTIGNAIFLTLCLYMVLTCLAGSKKMLIPLLIVNFSAVFYHPYTTISCLIIYIAAIVYCLLPFLGKHRVSKGTLSQLLTACLSIIALFILWVWSFFGHTIVSGIISIFEAVSVEDRGIGNAASLMDSANQYGYGLDTVFRIAGINIFIYVMLLFAGIIFICKFWKDNRYFLMKALFICAVFVLGIVLISMAGDFVGGPGRFLRLLYITAILATGFVLYQLFTCLSHSRLRKQIIHTGIIFVIIVSVCFVSVFSYYGSPTTYGSSSQSPQTLTTAAETLIPRIDYSNAETTGLHFTALQRYVNALYGSPYNVGSYEGGTYHMISTSRGEADSSESVPYHFGYDTGATSLADAYADGTYIFIIDKDRQFYQAYYPEMIQFRWTPQDFKQLSVDKGLHSVYNNGGMEMYMVK